MLAQLSKNGSLHSTNGARSTLAPGQRTGRRARAADCHTRHIVISIGGAGCGTLPELAAMDHDLADFMIGFDTDMKVIDDLGGITGHFHLGCESGLADVLANRVRYSYLRGDALALSIEAFPTEQGVGRIRMATSVLLGYNLTRIKVRLRRLLERALARFRGASPKRLVVHFVFSIAGGTGSAGSIPLAALVHDAARSISARLCVKTIAHAIGPGLFISRVDTPAEIERTYANAPMTLRELKLAQRRGGLDRLCQALAIAPLGRPLFNEIAYYDLADSGSAVHSLEQVQARVAANIIVAENQSLDALVGARDINPFMARRGVRADEQETAVIKSEHGRVLRAPVVKLADAHAAASVRQELLALNRPADRARVNLLVAQHLAALGLDTAEREAHEQLRSGAESGLPVTLGRMSDSEVFLLCQRVRDHWLRRGRGELARKASDMAGSLETEARGRAGRFIAAVTGHAQGFAELTLVLRDALDAVDERCSQAQRQLEGLARKDTDAAYRRAAAALERAGWLSPHRRLREQLGQAVADLLATELKQAVLGLSADHVLAATRSVLSAELERIEHLAKLATVAARQLETQHDRVVETIGHEGDYYQEVVQPGEAPEVLRQLARDVAARMGDHTQLSLASLLGSAGDAGLADAVGAAVEAHRRRAQSYCGERLGDLAGFLEHFALSTRVDEWLREAAEVVLPCSLNLAFHGPGNAPLRAYLAAAPSMRAACLEAIERGGPLGFEFCDGDPFEIVVRAKISQVPFTSIPGLEELERAYDEFRAAAPTDHVWGVLASHGAVQAACDETLLDGGDVMNDAAAKPLDGASSE